MNCHQLPYFTAFTNNVKIYWSLTDYHISPDDRTPAITVEFIIAPRFFLVVLTFASAIYLEIGSCFISHQIYLAIGDIMYLLTEWEGWTGKYLAHGPYVLAESQIFSHLARPNSVYKHFNIWPLCWKFCLNLNVMQLHNIRWWPHAIPL